MSKKNRKKKNRHFKFKHLTASRRTGESGSGSQMQEQYQSIRHLLMYSETAIMQLHVSDLQMQVTFTDAYKPD